MNDEPRAASLLERLGLQRPEVRAWALYDWANSAFITTIVAAVFPIYFGKVAAAGMPDAVASYRYGLATTIALAVIALIAPVLGAIADRLGNKKRFLAAFMLLGVASTACMAFVGQGDWLLALVLFGLANIGAFGSLTFYDSLLPHLASGEELDRVSTAGYAIGYLGGGLLLALNLAWIQKPEWFGLADAGVATRLSFVSVAVWWLLFALPLLRRVPEPALHADPRSTRGTPSMGVVARPSARQLVTAAFAQVWTTLGSLRRYRNAFLMLLAFLLYSDGINTIIRMSTLYGTQIGIDQGSLIAALLMVQFVGVPFAFAFGRIADQIGARKAIFAALAVYVVISVLAFAMRTATHFFILAFLVAMVQGGSQALSRSLFASMIPKRRSSEFFGFFGIFEKFGNLFGPLLFALAVRLMGSTRAAIPSVIIFFIAGAVVLARVDLADGQRVAAEEDAGPQTPVAHGLTGIGDQGARP
jgi:MFS transporter, UMF1 family